MLLPRGELGFVFGANYLIVVDVCVQTVEESIVCRSGTLPLGVKSCESWLVEPIHDRKDTQVDVPVCTRWSMDNKRSGQSVGVLEGKMAVIPGVSIRSTMERVCERRAWGNGTYSTVRRIAMETNTLCDTWNAIVGNIFGHQDSVPMNRGTMSQMKYHLQGTRCIVSCFEHG